MSQAPKVILRKPRVDDIDVRLALGFSPEIVRMYGGDAEHLPKMTRNRAEAWYRHLANHACAWVIEADGRLVGQGRLDDINETDRRARLALGLLHPRDLGRGIGRAAVGLMLDHAFDKLGLHRVDLRVLAYNERAIRCYRACGFVHEGTERQAAWVDGAWHDDWIMGILQHEYRGR